MRISVLALAIATAFYVAPFASADDGVTYTRFLVPFDLTPVPGAYGSLWEVDTWVYNAGEGRPEIIPSPGICPVTCPFPNGGNLEPGWPPLPVFYVGGPFAESGVLYHIDSRYAADVTFVSRIRDLSRQAETAGTEVPVIREDGMSAEPIDLLNVPLTTTSRNMLRIYALPEVTDPEVEVRIFRMPQRQPNNDLTVIPLHSQTVQLRAFPPYLDFRLQPSIAQLGALESLPELLGEDAVWIKIVPVTPGLRIWAFVSVTNNETQQVTIITP